MRGNDKIRHVRVQNEVNVSFFFVFYNLKIELKKAVLLIYMWNTEVVQKNCNEINFSERIITTLCKN